MLDAYSLGLEQRLAQGLPFEHIASVASFFVSRIDTLADARLGQLIASGDPFFRPAASLLGKAAIAERPPRLHRFQAVPRHRALAAARRRRRPPPAPAVGLHQHQEPRLP